MSSEGQGTPRIPDLNVITTLKPGERMVAYRASMYCVRFLRKKCISRFQCIYLFASDDSPLQISMFWDRI
jgi:hypothetical protein